MKRAAWVIVVATGLAGLVWFAWPQPVLVDLAVVARGPMEVTVDDDGKTNVPHIYTVSAPIAGKVLRISHPVGGGSNFCSRRRPGDCQSNCGRPDATDHTRIS